MPEAFARQTIGEIQSVTIRRLRKGTRPNWKVADIVPQPSSLVSRKIRGALAPFDRQVYPRR
jgi:hypothetical protein